MASARSPYRVHSTPVWWSASSCSPKLQRGWWIAALSPLCSSFTPPTFTRPKTSTSTGSRRRRCPRRSRSATSGGTSCARYVALRTAPSARASSGAPPSLKARQLQARGRCSAPAANGELWRRTRRATRVAASTPPHPPAQWPIDGSSGNGSRFMFSSAGLQRARKAAPLSARSPPPSPAVSRPSVGNCSNLSMFAHRVAQVRTTPLGY